MSDPVLPQIKDEHRTTAVTSNPNPNHETRPENNKTGNENHDQKATEPIKHAATTTTTDAIAIAAAITSQWQALMDRGRTHTARRELERASHVFTSALHLCDRYPDILTPHRFRFRVLGDLGWVERLSGRYETALEVLREAVSLSVVLLDSATATTTDGGKGEDEGYEIGWWDADGDRYGDAERRVVESVRREGENAIVGDRVQSAGTVGEAEREAHGESYSRPSLFIAGEIGTVYRQLGKLEEAREAFRSQLAIARRLGIDGPQCRARVNLGIVRYQLALRRWEIAEAAGSRGDGNVREEVEGMVALAMDHLQKGIEIAERIRAEESKRGGHRPDTREREARAWKALGYARMALCYCLWAAVQTNNEKEMLEKAADAGRKAVDSAGLMLGSILPMARFSYGHVLLKQGHKELALDQFNNIASPWPWQAITPVMVMCKEPSDEHRGYLAEMIEAGADLDVVDPDGYTALDHAVFSGDAECETMLLNGLRKQLNLSDTDVAARRTEAHLRKGYREMLQEKLRPILYRRDEDPDCMKKLRRVYAEALAADPRKSRFFDRLKFIRYTDFRRFGRLPRSSDGLVRSYEDGEDLDVLVFFSYRWLNQDKSLNTPDDANHTQYRRMLDAAELYMQQNPSVDETKLCVWMDFACVDQDNPGTGVSALPIIITQCDAVISLVDDTYYDRAWCCVEAMMIAQLRRAVRSKSNFHAWYEHKAVAGAIGQSGNGDSTTRGWTLQKAPTHPSLDMKDKKLTYELDRPKVMFLERQSRFLGPLGRQSWDI
ncbi:hypothetical protein N657DRAFT_680349 [Parathielavia appendiculata]|uniref:Uncharacterized protein n=1 Tax=Parathielavia appendiculata TaxID=2587402 RepID=A0AAN6Z3L0_9PEZI|nr:hypothetical protein N657DRAFT_680349 [Parathielavia appendiculata]